MAAYQTHQKRILVDFMSANFERQFTVDELIDELTRVCGGEAPGRSTVYRLIGRLVECGTVKRFVKGNSRQFLYQIAGGEECHHHLHLKCTQCGKLLHMQHEQSDEILEQIFGCSDFEVNRENTTLFGCCGECRRQNDEENSKVALGSARGAQNCLHPDIHKAGCLCGKQHCEKKAE